MKNRGRQMAVWAAVILLLAAAGLAGPMTDVPPRELRAPLADLPQELGQWRATTDDQRLDPRALDVLRPTSHLLRAYERGPGQFCALFVAFFARQQEGQMIHSPLHCLPGEGWVIGQRTLVEVPGPGGPWRVNHLVLTRDLDRLSVLYWYQGRGRVLASEYADRALLIWDGLTQDRADGALVRLISLDEPTPMAALAMQTQFAAELIPALARLLPDPGRPASQGPAGE